MRCFQRCSCHEKHTKYDRRDNVVRDARAVRQPVIPRETLQLVIIIHRANRRCHRRTKNVIRDTHGGPARPHTKECCQHRKQHASIRAIEDEKRKQRQIQHAFPLHPTHQADKMKKTGGEDQEINGDCSYDGQSFHANYQAYQSPASAHRTPSSALQKLNGTR